MKLELWLPAKPYWTTQAWGLYNPAYLKFGFSRHNGIDYLLGDDRKLYFPQRYRIIWKGYEPEGGGHFVIGVSVDQWEIEGFPCWDRVTFMHLAAPTIWNIGDVAEIGSEVGIPDNTGFSTGPHTHERHQRVKFSGELIDKNDANGSYDHSKYQLPYCAKDKDSVITILKQIIALLSAFLKGRTVS